MKELCANLLEALRKNKPLIHHITNYVTVNDCANITLAIGASPIMADAIEEVADIAQISSAVVLNMGTINSRTAASMLAAGKAANKAGIPVIFDPVGAGASHFRNQTAADILKNIEITSLRGNISEIRFLAGISSQTKGVDASENDLQSNDNAVEIAKTLAKRYKCTVAITGASDIITNGTNAVCINNGHPMLAGLTGTGCMCSSLIGSFCGCAKQTPFEATAAALLSMGIAGEIAFEKAGLKGNGSFKVALHNAISQMNKATILERAEIYET